jgi:peptide/nickel transport system permease protein
MVKLGRPLFYWAISHYCTWTGMRDPLAQAIGDRLQPPSAKYWFGTDELGRDVFSRVIYGARISLPIGFVVIMFAMFIGSLVGATAGYIGGIYDLLIMRVADMILAFPSIVLALAIAAVLGPGIMNALIAMVLVWPEYARFDAQPGIERQEQRICGRATAIGVPPSACSYCTSFRTPLFQPSQGFAGCRQRHSQHCRIELYRPGAVPPTPE